MKNIIWIQTPESSAPNLLSIDGVCERFQSLDNQIQAMDYLLNFSNNTILRLFLSENYKKQLIQELGLPNNFSFYSDSSTLFLQGTLSSQDKYGRNIPFMLWSNCQDINEMLNHLERICVDNNLMFTPKDKEKYIKVSSIVKKRMYSRGLLFLFIVAFVISCLIWKIC